MLWLKLAWAGIKKYWHIIALGVGGLAAALLLRRDSEPVSDVIRRTKEAHDKEIEEIKKAHESEREQLEQNREDFDRKLDQIQREYDLKREQLDEDKRRAAEELLTRHANDPEKLARELAEVTGFDIIMPSDD